MATLQQASQHYAWLQEQANNQARLEAERNAQLAGINASATNQQAAIQAQREAAANIYAQQQEQQRGLITSQLAAQQQVGQERQQVIGGQLQSALSAQGAQQQAGLQAQHFDLQAQFNQIQLTQSEQMRMQRLRNGIDAVKNHPGLSPDEKQNLIMQMQTGLNPLEQRQQQANILHTQIQTQGMFQQNEQQGVLFAQRQNRIAQGAAGNIQTIYNPDTGMNERYMADIQTGELRPLESPSSELMRQMQLAAHAQQIQFNAQTMGERVRGVGLQNQATEAGIGQTHAQTFYAQQNAERIRSLLPNEIAHGGLNNTLLQQAIDQGPAAFSSSQAYRAAQTEVARANAERTRALTPNEITTGDLNIRSLRMAIDQGPAAFQSAQAYRAAQTRSLNTHSDNAIALLPFQIDEATANTMRTRATTTALNAANTRGVPDGVLGHFVTEAIATVGHRINSQQFQTEMLQRFPIPAGATPEQRAAVMQRRDDYVRNILNTEPSRIINQSINAFSGARPQPQGMGAPNAGPQPGPRPQNGQQLLAQFEQNAQGAPLQPEPQAANALEPILNTVTRLRDQGTSRLDNFAIGPNLRGDLGTLRDLLAAAHQRNTGMTPAEETEYRRVWQHLHDAGGDSRRMAERIRLPGTEPPKVGTVPQLRALHELLSANRPGFFSSLGTGALAISGMRAELNRAIQAGRGLTPGEVQEYNRLRAELGGDRANYGRIHDQTALPER